MAHWSEKLNTMGACREAVWWARTQPSPEAAWKACERPDWMFWVMGKTGADQREIVRAACEIARVAVERYTDGEVALASLLALHVAEEWSYGRADKEDAEAAGDAAWAAAEAAWAAAEDAAARAAEAAAWAAWAAAKAAAWAARAAEAAAWAARAAWAAADAAEDAEAAARKEQAEIIRELVTMPRLP